MENNPQKPQEKAKHFKASQTFCKELEQYGIIDDCGHINAAMQDYCQQFIDFHDKSYAVIIGVNNSLRTKLEAMEVENLKLKDEVERLRQVDDHHPPGYDWRDKQ